MKNTAALFVIIVIISLVSCNTGPDPIKTGIDNCYFCKMTISDPRFGAEIITKKGKTYKFDDTHCILSFLKTNELTADDIKGIYLSNYCETHELLNVKGSFLLQTNNLRGPMGGNIAAFSNTDSLKKIQEHFSGVSIQWSEINK